jgi:hypothetical protein
MRYGGLLVLLAGLLVHSNAQNDADGPSNEKAQKTYKEGLGYRKST